MDYSPPTPQPEPIQCNDNIYYNCNECYPLIEIISINGKNNTVKFRCLNKNDIKIISIKEFLEKMEKNKEEKIINRKCESHDVINEYIFYCLDCKFSLCQECLKTKILLNHMNNNGIIDVQPNEEDFKIIEK